MVRTAAVKAIGFFSPRIEAMHTGWSKNTGRQCSNGRMQKITKQNPLRAFHRTLEGHGTRGAEETAVEDVTVVREE